MRFQIHFLLFIIAIHQIVILELPSSVVGVCYGRVANKLIPPMDVVSLLISNGISKARIFDADPTTLKAFSNTGIELIIEVPNKVDVTHPS
ncbi:hypothetical protein GIB67_019973 [Kingdonia uniflora]|uniref:Glucan endo-1,3-beta-D-glucosidase n=1 Tax=Kingdonia uniflora TaxID=39325 RepID=A0A7J7MKR7_9MAGN|nr:hypothetical protein GIB67_019973 [Kingdonia uniflora]